MPTTHTFTPRFIANKYQNGSGGLPTEATLPLVDFPIPVDISLTQGPLAFDFDYRGQFGLEINVERPNQTYDLEYPVETTVTTPDFFTPGEFFTVNTGNTFFSASPSIATKGMTFGGISLDMLYGHEPGGFTNVGLMKVRGFDPWIDLPDGTFQEFEETKKSIASVKVGAGTKNKLDGWLKGIEFELNLLPDGAPKEGVGRDRGPAGLLEPIDVSTNQLLWNVDADLLKLISRLPTPASSFFDSLSKNVKLEQGVMGTVFSVDAGYKLFDAHIEGGVSLKNEIDFYPNDIEVEIEIAGQKQRGKLGEEFNFIAPEDVEGPLSGTISYSLEGMVETINEYVPTGGYSAEVLSGKVDVRKDGVPLWGINGKLGPAWEKEDQWELMEDGFTAAKYSDLLRFNSEFEEDALTFDFIIEREEEEQEEEEEEEEGGEKKEEEQKPEQIAAPIEDDDEAEEEAPPETRQDLGGDTPSDEKPMDDEGEEEIVIDLPPPPPLPDPPTSPPRGFEEPEPTPEPPDTRQDLGGNPPSDKVLEPLEPTPTPPPEDEGDDEFDLGDLPPPPPVPPPPPPSFDPPEPAPEPMEVVDEVDEEPEPEPEPEEETEEFEVAADPDPVEEADEPEPEEGLVEPLSMFVELTGSAAPAPEPSCAPDDDACAMAAADAVDWGETPVFDALVA